MRYPWPWGHFARLAGVGQMKDGSLLLTDDTNNTVYRIAYGAKNTPRPVVPALDARRLAFDLVSAPNTLCVASTTFASGGTIPFSSTAYDKNMSPDLRVSNLPKGAKSLVLMMEDPDSRSPKPTFHWLVAGIPANSPMLPKNVAPNSQPMGALQGGNLLGETAYFGPRPPADGKVHHYHFQLFALAQKLNLQPGFNRVALLDALGNAKVLAKGETIGLYERKPF